MKKLRTKVFWTIFGIMTGALLLAVIIYNIRGYLNLQDFIQKNLGAPIEHWFFNRVPPDALIIEAVIHNFYDSLYSSIIFFAVFCGIFFVISKFLTNWIVKPVDESFEKQRTFIADASHELKTPLAVIMASSDALKENPQEKKWINNIQEESNRMSKLITNLLELASTEEKITSHFKTENLSKIIELSALTFEGKAFEKNININMNIEQNLSLNMDENDIKQLVEILLDNAIKHSQKGSSVILNLKKSNKQIILEVKNIGEAIAPGDEEKIFERFYRVDKVRNTKEKRYGLGLAIAKNIVNNHNGKISAKSENGYTIFTACF